MESETASLFLNYSVELMEQMSGRLRVCLARLSEEDVWRRHGAHENSVGNLVLHLCGNMRQWILHGVGGQPDVREREAEFSASGEISRAELMERFTATVAEARAVIGGLPQARLVERTTPQGREVSVLEAIYQVTSHLREHVGQIILLTKQMTGQDLDLTIPRPR
jgi:uncharacterized damage-inducible protein DinB